MQQQLLDIFDFEKQWHVPYGNIFSLNDSTDPL